ncbi:MAG: hypothetical protein BKP49_03940 [Treponema sp. CETP13]|nr:MAG: hypothetical protein BKP49_03940 [Treponema sp. CETP13]
MPIKVILYIIFMVFIAIFFGINGKNSCDINLLFTEFTGVPVITTILISFAAGIFVMLPFTFGRKKKKKEDVQNISAKEAAKTTAKTNKEAKKVAKSAKKTHFFERANKKDTKPTDLKSKVVSEDESPTVINSSSSSKNEEKNDKNK